MIEELLNTPFFGLAVCCVAWTFGLWLQKKTGALLCNPLLVGIVTVVIFLTAFGISYERFYIGGQYVGTMVTPLTAVLALNIYRQRSTLKEFFVPVLAGCIAGCVTSILLVFVLCRVLQVDAMLQASFLPKSVTTAIAIDIAHSRGGSAGLATVGVILAGMTGAVFSPAFAKLFHIENPVAEGIGIGASSHALGTTRALKIGSVQGAMSSISICVCGIFTSIIMIFV